MARHNAIITIISLRGTAMAQSTTNTTTVQVKVGVVLDMNTWVGKMGLKGISMALSDFYSSHVHYKTRLELHVRDSKDNVVGAAAAVLLILVATEDSLQPAASSILSYTYDQLVDNGGQNLDLDLMILRSIWAQSI
ncbi:hypothetical protein HYC85_001514 [Camellia sinensis]|uniref:Receptor ligand binding region domain-containing protein n=1 Tax=Camellia sinensis TaxID=4442 RepID=A0A7J7I678_CAMSI|nr:hypothetical protein HYC85_001514 [Camellia sinensis]